MTCHCSGTIFSPAFFAQHISNSSRAQRRIWWWSQFFGSTNLVTQQPLRSHCSPCWTSDWVIPWNMGGFYKWGYPNSWVIKWTILVFEVDDLGLPRILRKPPHFSLPDFGCFCGQLNFSPDPGRQNMQGWRSQPGAAQRPHMAFWRYLGHQLSCGLSRRHWDNWIVWEILQLWLRKSS